MPARSIPCRACGRPVPAEALACPSCSTPVATSAQTSAESAEVVEASEVGGRPSEEMPTLQPDAPLYAPAAPPEAVASEAALPEATAPETAPPEVAAPEATAPEATALVPPDSSALGGVVRGSYLPPSTVHRPATPVATAPSPGSWAAPGPGAGAAVPPAPVDRPGPPGRASLFADLPFDAPDSLAEWLVAAGSAAAALSFLLPWAPGTVSYVTSWGLSSAGRLPVLAVLVVAAALAILPNRVATWVRLGVLGLLGGALYLGLLWPYVFGDFGADFGAVIGASAAIVLIVGGILGVAPRREQAKPA